MTFAELYGTKLSIELGSADTTQLFTTARRKQAVNDAALAFVRLTGCTVVYGTISVVSGTGEYDLETNFTNYLRLDSPPSLSFTLSGDTRYVQGDDLVERTPDWLDWANPGWRAATAGTPTAWYLRVSSGVTYLGFYPAPSLATGETGSILVPYVASPATLTGDTDVPFSIGSVSMDRLRAYHQGLVHYAAGALEPLRKNYTGADRQMKLFNGYVAMYLQDHPAVAEITMQRSYLGESKR